MNRLRPWLLSLVCLLGSSLVLGAGLQDKLAAYVYQDNRQLVRLVEEAAALIESRGTAAVSAFGTRDSKWFNEENYLLNPASNLLKAPEPHDQSGNINGT